MESPQPVIEPEKRNQTPLIITIVAVVLCCCCLVMAIAGYYGYNTMRVTESEILPFEEPTPDVQLPDTDQDDFEVPSEDLGIGEAPTGGLGNDVLRNDTWTYVAFAAMGQGCEQPVGSDTTIEVLQEPQNGIWVEKWTVACTSGDTYPYEVEYVLDDTGATFNIKSLP
jgi:hypothetical protein